MEQYSWKAGAQFPVKAEIAAVMIKNLQASLGKETINANELLDASRDENAPLHNCFEWNDTIAAENFRRAQAAHLIRSIEVKIIRNDREPTTIRALVNVQSDTARRQGEYISIRRAMDVPEYRTRVLKDALSELRSFQKKYSIYEELADVCTAINSFADKLK